MAKNRKSAWKRAKVWRDMSHTAKVNTNPALCEGRVHSHLNKPQVGFQGTFRAPRQVGEGADAPAFYKSGARSKPQKLGKATRLMPPNRRPHDRSNLPKP